MRTFFNINLLRVIVFAAILFSFFVKGVYFLDPDFGWRVAAGQMYLKSGIPKTDPFSYTMPDFPWVDHAWLTSLIMGFGYERWGFAFLSLLFAGLATASIVIVGSTVKSKLELPNKGIWKLVEAVDIPLLAVYSILFLFFGIRAQIFSWLGFSIVLWLTYNRTRLEKFKWILPPLFMIWANLHGSFLIGLSTYLVLIGINILREKKLNIIYIVLLILSIICTLINPYGIGIWREVFSSIFDFTLSKRVVEWMPAITMVNLVMIFYIAYSFSFIWFEKNKLNAALVVLYLLFLLAAMASRRHLPLWLIVSYPLTVFAVNNFSRRIKKIKFASGRFIYLHRFVWLALIAIATLQFIADGKSAFVLTEEGFYPKEAVGYLKTNKLEGRMFSDYAWGGYLIWKLPGNKVFIDGRMPSWKDSGGYKAMDEYVDLLLGKTDLNEFLDKYEIEYVLWTNFPHPTPESFKIKMSNRWGKLLGIGEKDFNMKKALNNTGWKVVFQDNVSVLYSRN